MVTVGVAVVVVVAVGVVVGVVVVVTVGVAVVVGVVVVVAVGVVVGVALNREKNGNTSNNLFVRKLRAGCGERNQHGNRVSARRARTARHNLP